MNSKACVVEFQAFRGVNNVYLIKEFVAVDITTRRYVIVLFAPPYDRLHLHPKIQKINTWIENHHHRIRWNDGNVPYKDLVRIVSQTCSDFSTVYTKGSEKTTFLRQYHGEVIDLDNIQAPAVPSSFKPSVQCPVPHHQPDTTPLFHCALRKALFYADWIQQRCQVSENC